MHNFTDVRVGKRYNQPGLSPTFNTTMKIIQLKKDLIGVGSMDFRALLCGLEGGHVPVPCPQC